MKTRTIHKALSMLLTAAMVLNMGLIPVFATEGTPPGISGVCIHHTEHSADCGYKQGTPCTHEHKVNGGEADREGPLGGTEDCYTKTDNCKHEHDEACGYTPDSPCRFDPASCTECKPGNQPIEKVCTCPPVDSGELVHGKDCPLYTALECTCPPVDSGELVHGKDCPLYTAPELSEAVKALIAMVDLLPAAEAITEENRETIKPAFDAALTAYEALSDDNKTVFETTEQYAKLMALHTALYPIALMTNEATWDISTGSLTLDNNCGANCTHTVTGTSTGGTISVTGGTHNVTLDNVTIDVSATESACAFEITNGAAVNLMLTGTNTLKSGNRRAGLEVSTGNTLTITDASTGSLGATGGLYGAGIGGGYDAGGTINMNGGIVTATGGQWGAGIGGGSNGAGGTITINGGAVTATGNGGGAGIGGGNYGAGGAITINGGTVTATGGSGGAGIGGGYYGAGGNITISGTAVVFATKGSGAPNHIGAGATATGGTVTKTGGIIFEGTAGSLYAANVTPSDSFTLPTAYTLTIEVGKALTVSSEKTLTNNGTINNLGTVQNDGTLINKGTLSGNGSLTGEGVIQTALTESMISLNQDSYVYTGSAFEPTVTVASTPWTGAAPFVKDTDYAVGYSENTAAGTATVTVTPQGSKLTGSAINKTFTITKSASALTLTTDKVGNTVTYGDTITFTANVSVAPAKGRSAAVDTVDFYYGDTKLNTDPILLTESGTATFTYDTRDKVIPTRTHTITAKYGGSGNLNGVTQTVNVTLNRKVLTATVNTKDATASKVYDGNADFKRVSLTLTGVESGDNIFSDAYGSADNSNAGTGKPFTAKTAFDSGGDTSWYYFSIADITGTVSIKPANPTITVETDKSSHLGGKEITVTVKITNPADATSGFPAASEIAITPTNATEKTALAQQGTTGVYIATYTLADYSAGLKAKFAATVPNATTNYNANTTGTTSDEVEILNKYTPTVTLAADKTNITYGNSITLTATVGKNGQTSPLAGTVQFELDNANHGSSVVINTDGAATITVGKETLTAGSHGFKAEFIPENSSDYKGKTSDACIVTINEAEMAGKVIITGTPKFGETLTADTSGLSGQEGDNLGTFQYEWFNSKNVTLGNETTYTIQEADIDGSISLQVIPANGNYDRKISLSVKPTKADSTLSITGNPTKTYDGTAVSNPATSQTGSTGAVTFEWYDLGGKLDSAPKDAGSYYVKALLAETATHEGVTAFKGFIIDGAPLAVTGYTAENKNYDGKRDATVSAVAFSGLQNGESLTLGTDYTTAASFADQNANNGIAVAGTVTLATTATASNYSLASNTLSGQTADIAAINPIYSVANQKITLNKTLTAIQASGAAVGVNGESVAGTLKWSETSGGAALADSYSFTGNVDDIKTLYWTFTSTSSNYKTLSGSTVFTLTDKKVPVLTVPNIVEIYSGKAITAVNGTAKEDSTTVAGTFAFDGAPTMKNAGIYNATVKFTPNDTESYEIATTSITVTINQATVGIALNLSKDRITAGEALPTPSIAYSGLVSGESLTPATAPIFAGMPSGGTEGTYTITWSNKAAMQAEIEALPVYQNYTASYKDSVTLTIDKRSGGGDNPGGDGGSGGGSIIPPVTPEKPTPPITAESNVNSKTDKNGNATAVVAGKDITNAIDKAQKEAGKNGTEANGIAIVLNVKTDKNATALNVTLLQKLVTALIAEKVTSVTVKNDLSTVTLDLATLKALAGGDVILSVSKADTGKLSAEAKTAIAGRPVFQFGLTSGGKTVSDFKGGKAGLQIPYTPTTNEQIGNLCGVYVEGNGKVNWLETSSYDSITGMMLISAQHFSTYGIGYKQSTPKFTDVGTHWAKNDIDFVVARGLLTGTSNTTFAPDQSITRGALQSALEKLSGKSMAAVVGGNATATVTRQEMAVMLVNYSKAIGYKLPGVHAEVNFTDANSIASWAKDAVKQTQMAGILTGKSGNRFDPTATATRAEVSAMLRRYVELVVNTETAEGWSMNESGQWMYIEDGKRVTGSKTIDGKAYTFDQYGVTTALPPERKYLTYTVQKGDSFWAIASKYKVNIFELVSLNGKTIFSTIHPGDEVKIPQK